MWCCSFLVAGTVIEVNVSELGLVTQTGKVVWGALAFCSIPYGFGHLSLLPNVIHICL